jgi:hypothetical protein
MRDMVILTIHSRAFACPTQLLKKGRCADGASLTCWDLGVGSGWDLGIGRWQLLVSVSGTIVPAIEQNHSKIALKPRQSPGTRIDNLSGW